MPATMPSAPDKTQAKLLFIDDEQKVLSSMKAMFRRKFHVLTANSGSQALEMLEKINKTLSSEDEAPVLLSSLDPALPYGGGMDWGLTDTDGNPVKIVRSASNHLVLVKGEVIVVCENHFERLVTLRNLSETTWQSVIQLLKDYLKIPHPLRKQNRIEIDQINHRPAAEDPVAKGLLDSGFEQDGDKLVLWAEV